MAAFYTLRDSGISEDHHHAQPYGSSDRSPALATNANPDTVVAFIPWLIDHYEYVYWVDYRYSSNTISQMVQDYGVQDVIISLQIYNATTKNAIPKLLNIGQ